MTNYMDKAIDPQQRIMLECAYEAIENGMFEQVRAVLHFSLNFQKRVLRYTHLLERTLGYMLPSLFLNMQYSFFGTLKPYQCSRRPDALTL